MADDFFLLGPELQTQRQTIFDTPATLGEYLSAQRESSFENTYTRLLQQYVQRPEGGQRLTKDVAQDAAKRLGINMSVPDDGIDYDAFSFNAMRQIKLQNLNRTIQRKPDGVTSTMLGIGAMLGPQILDPIGMAANFIPVVGPARYTAALKNTTSLAGRAAIRAGAGATEGAVVTAALEPANYFLANSLGDDYDAYDSFMNVAFGAGFGGTISAGGGLMSDAWGAGFRGIASAVPKTARDEILQAATNRFLRDGDVDVAPMIDAATRTKTLSTMNEIGRVSVLAKDVADGKIPEINASKARAEYLKDKPELEAKIIDLETKLSSKDRTYSNAINEYNDAQNFIVRTPEDQIIRDKKISDLENKYGKNFKQEADDYQVYKQKRDQLESGVDSSRKKTLERELGDLDKKYNGRLSDAYNVKRDQGINSENEYFAIQKELNDLNAQQSLGIQMKMLDMQDEAMRAYESEKMNFASSYSDVPKQKIDYEVSKIDDEINNLQEIDDGFIDETINDLKQMSDEFEQRTGIVVEEIDDADFNFSDVVSAMKNYMNCIRR